MLRVPEAISEPGPPPDEWSWPLAADSKTGLRQLGTDGRYKLSGILDSGGQALIWYATDAETGDAVAIKTPRPDGAFRGQLAARRMTREARIMRSISPHPHVMPLLECGPEHLMRQDSPDLRPRAGDRFASRDPWLVMPLVPHLRLTDLVKEDEAAPDDWRRIARGYAAALAHLHAGEVVHRDLSPGNVLLTSAGPMVTDFGVSWAPSWVETDQGIELTMSTGLTQQQAAAWTQDWHAPEVLSARRGERPDRDPAYDVFSWGLFVASMSERRHPWSNTHGNLGLEDFERARLTGFQPPYELSGPLAAADGWAALVLEALAPRPADRPTAAELVRHLDDERSVTDYPLGTPARPRRTAGSGRAAPLPLSDEDARAVRDLHEALRERWRSDPVWNRVGAGVRLPIGWEVTGAPVPSDVAADEHHATSRLISIWETGRGGRTVLLGAAGSGKSELLVGVFRELLTGWTIEQPLPLLIPMASWDPAFGDLRTWLIDWLHINHQFLDRPVTGPVPKTLAARLLDDQRFTLVLDGLDEVLDKAPRDVIEQLNNLEGPARLLISCRTENLATADLFPGAPTITLRSQNLGDVLTYLRRKAPDQRKWDPVTASLPDRPDIAEVFRTPLMVMLAESIYNRRPGETPGDRVPDPRELLDRHGAEELTQNLLRGFVPAKYAHESADYTTEEAGRWLGYLARMITDGELRWWDLRVRSMSTSRVVLHSVTLVGVVVWTALSAGGMNAFIYGQSASGVTDAIRITAAALICYGALGLMTGSYAGALLAAIGAYITGTLSSSYDLALVSGLATGFAWRPLALRASGRRGDLWSAIVVAVVSVVVAAATRAVAFFVPLHESLVIGFGAGTLDGFTIRWDEDVNGWLATGLVAGALTWTASQVLRVPGPPVASRWWTNPLVHGLLAGLAVCAINSWADGARPGIDRPWLIAPSDGLAFGLTAWWVSFGTRRRVRSPRWEKAGVRLAAAVVLGGLTTGLNVLGYVQRPDVEVDLARALSEGIAVAIFLWFALRPVPAGDAPRKRTFLQTARAGVAAGLAGLLVAAPMTISKGPAVGLAGGVALSLVVLFFLLRGRIRSSAEYIDPIEAGILGLTIGGLLTGFPYALIFGLVSGLGSRVSTDIWQRRLPSLRANVPWKQTVGGALLGTMAAFAAAANGYPVIWLAVIGVTGGVAGAYAFGIRGDDPRNRLAASPSRLFQQDRKVFFRLTAIIAVAIGAAVGVRTVAGGQSTLTGLAGAATALATYGLTAGLLIATSATRYGVFAVKNAWLAAGDELPWRLMRFLDDAHTRRQVLRTAGSTYQFRHELLREQIAELYDRPR